MADARRTVNISFDGNTNGLRRAGVSANNTLNRVGKTASGVTSALGGMLAKFLLFGPLVLIVAVAAKAAAGLILLIPAAILSLAASIGVIALAVSGFSDAIKAATPEEFVTATRSMAPAMRDAVVATRRARPEFYALRRLVQQGFWEGFNTDLRRFLDGYMPMLRTRLPQLASSLANLRSSLVTALLQPETMAALDSFLRLTTNMFYRMSGGLAAFLRGFIKLANIGGQFMPRFGDWITKIATMFEDWVDAGAASGSISRFIESSLLSLRQLYDITVSLGFAIAAIIKAVTSGDGLQTFVDFAESIRSFFEGDFGQSLLKTLTNVLNLFYQIFTLITNALAAIRQGTGGGAVGGGIISRISSFVSGLFGRAGGGPVLAGRSYVVGERGREVLTMGSQGFVTPNSSTGGGDTYVTVMIGDTELRGIVTTEIQRYTRDVARSVYSGLGVAG